MIYNKVGTLHQDGFETCGRLPRPHRPTRAHRPPDRRNLPHQTTAPPPRGSSTWVLQKITKKRAQNRGPNTDPFAGPPDSKTNKKLKKRGRKADPKLQTKNQQKNETSTQEKSYVLDIFKQVLLRCIRLYQTP